MPRVIEKATVLTRGTPAVAASLRIGMAFLGCLPFTSGALAAPDEQALGKDEGYPICPGSLRPEMRCVVGLVKAARHISLGEDMAADGRAHRRRQCRRFRRRRDAVAVAGSHGESCGEAVADVGRRLAVAVTDERAPAPGRQAREFCSFCRLHRA